MKVLRSLLCCYSNVEEKTRVLVKAHKKLHGIGQVRVTVYDDEVIICIGGDE